MIANNIEFNGDGLSHKTEMAVREMTQKRREQKVKQMTRLQRRR